MGVSTRPSTTHRQQRKITRCALAVVLFATTAFHTLAATSPEQPDVETTHSIAQDTTHEVSISVVQPGKEAIALVARLTTMSTHIARDVNWQVRNEAGELVLNATANELESPLAPGQYIVEAQYGCSRCSGDRTPDRGQQHCRQLRAECRWPACVARHQRADVI